MGSTNEMKKFLIGLFHVEPSPVPSYEKLEVAPKKYLYREIRLFLIDEIQ